MKHNLGFKNFGRIAVLFVFIWSGMLSLSPARNVQAAADFTVNMTTDAVDANTGDSICDSDLGTPGLQCTLRAAIQEANATAGANTIDFDTSIDGTSIVLSLAGTSEDNAATGDLDIKGDLTITGNGSTKTIIDANRIDRVFEVLEFTVVFNDLTIKGGNINTDGGGIYNYGATTLNRVRVTDNRVGRWGGGIYEATFFAAGSMLIKNSTIDNNTSLDNGGGIRADYPITIENSTISGNKSNLDGGGIYANSAVTLNHVTVAYNNADDNNAGGGNGGGLYRFSNTLTIQNSIIAQNTVGSSGSAPQCGGTITSAGYNQIGDITGCTITLTTGDATGDPLLDASLTNNGGPTPTHALAFNSPAIDHIPNGTNGCGTTYTTDQRGYPRPFAAKCDSGAFEVTYAVSPGVNGGDGPGGVGATDGSSPLEVWYRADRGVYTDGGCAITLASNTDNVGCWKDQSGNGVNAIAVAGSPTYNTNILNGQPALTFNGSNAQLVFNRIVQDDFTLISLFSTTQNTGGCTDQWYCGEGLLDAEVGNIVNDFGLTLSQGYVLTGVGNLAGADVTITSAAQYNNNAGHMAFFHRTASSGAMQQYVDGTQTGSNTGSTNSLTDPGFIKIGSLQTDLNYFSGYNPEAIVFSTNLPDVERILVQNYLSAKYNVSLSGTDVYDGDTTTNNDFDLDVAGIGQESGNQHTQAHAGGMIVLNNTFLQNDGDWLLFGHRTPVNSNNTTTYLPTDALWTAALHPVRWERYYYIDVTDIGAVGGKVDIIFDFSEGGMGGQNPAGPASNYRLLKRSGINVDFADITDTSGANVIINGDQVQFIGVDVSQLGSNFTLGSLDGVDSPTALTLRTLTARSTTLPIGVAALALLSVAGLMILRRKKTAPHA